MTGILAIETASEACSVALWRDGILQECHEITPRQHSQRLFGMLRELLPDGQLSRHGVDAIAYGVGPGSFTGLRIAASAVQGLAFANSLPAIPVSTLACQAQTALRLQLVDEGGYVFSALDARINEIYCATYQIRDGVPVELAPAAACPPAAAELAAPAIKAVGVGSGCQFAKDFPSAMADRLIALEPELSPHACDLVPLALLALERGELQDASAVQPVYVRDEINWKKIPQQGKQS